MPSLDTILNFLYDHIDKSGDCQARVKWEPNTVVLWYVVVFTALYTGLTLTRLRS